MKTLIIIIIILFSTYALPAQSKRLYKVYAFGRGQHKPDSCEMKISTKYGMRVVNAGCIVTLRKDWHNQRMERKLNRRNGEDWKERYRNEIKQCN